MNFNLSVDIEPYGELENSKVNVNDEYFRFAVKTDFLYKDQNIEDNDWDGICFKLRL